jgi:predicted DCC family thiol-disulfide oxidoreductase YuxK
MALASLLPLTAPLVWLFRLLPYHRRLADRAYRWVADHRGVPYGGSCKLELRTPEQPPNG